MRGYPRFFRSLLLAVLAAVTVSGVLLVPTTLMLRMDWDVGWRLGAGARIADAALHAAAGMATMLAIGALWSLHMRSGWRRRIQRGSGATLSTLMLVLSASAVGVYYLGEESPGTIAALAHLGAGAVAIGVFGWHWVHGRRRVMAMTVGEPKPGPTIDGPADGLRLTASDVRSGARPPVSRVAIRGSNDHRAAQIAPPPSHECDLRRAGPALLPGAGGELSMRRGRDRRAAPRRTRKKSAGSGQW